MNVTQLPTKQRVLADGIRAAHAHVTVAVVNHHQLVLAVNEGPYGCHSRGSFVRDPRCGRVPKV